MNKINNKKIIHSLFYSLVFMAILAFGTMAFIPLEANAMVCVSGVSSVNCGNSSIFGDDYNNGEINPVIYSLDPNSKNSGSGPINIMITGRNFFPGAIAKWNGSDRVTTYMNSTRLLMQLNDYDTNILGDF